MRKSYFVGLATLACSSSFANLVVDRGLPTTNINDVAGPNRSNVAWAIDNNTFTGDDFALPVTGTQWRIDSIRVWTVGDLSNNDANLTDDTFLSDAFSSLSLYVGSTSNSTLNRVALGNFSGSGTDSTTNANIVATRVQYPGPTELDYEGFGNHFTIVQLDFNNLNLVFNAGESVQFGLAADDPTFGFGSFNHASNAALSGSPQDGADNLFRDFSVDAGGLTASFLNMDNSDSNNGGAGWDKASDINVQVFATPVPEPATMAVLGLGALLLRRKKRA